MKPYQEVYDKISVIVRSQMVNFLINGVSVIHFTMNYKFLPTYKYIISVTDANKSHMIMKYILFKTREL